MKRIAVVYLAVVLTLSSVLVVSCSSSEGGDTGAIKNTINSMWNAYNRGNYAEALTYCTNYGEEEDEIAQMSAMKNTTGNVTVQSIENIIISGSTATATVNLHIAYQDDSEEVNLVKIDGT